MKCALGLDNTPHPLIVAVEDAGHAGWRKAYFRDGTSKLMSATELVKRYGCNPFKNVNPFSI